MATVAIISDSHDHLAALHNALAIAREAQAGVLIHCGDLSAPFVVRELGQGFSGPIHIVFGNNDADGRMLQVVAGNFPQITLHGIYAEVTIEGRRIAVIHYPEPARRIAASGQLDVVCYGHDHRKHIEQVGDCLLVNPGELLGLLGELTMALYDTEAHAARLVPVTGGRQV